MFTTQKIELFWVNSLITNKVIPKNDNVIRRSEQNSTKTR